MKDQPLQVQIETLRKIIFKNPNVKKILKSNPFPNNKHWYLGAGCVGQSVWNYLTNREITYGICDYDLVYYDSNTSKAAESKEQERINKLFKDQNIEIEVVNEARVHEWYEKDYGKELAPLKSVEDGINQWPSTALSLGVNYIDKKFSVYAPYGLNDLFNMIIRPNKPYAVKEAYENKVKKWTTKWPELKVLPWS